MMSSSLPQTPAATESNAIAPDRVREEDLRSTNIALQQALEQKNAQIANLQSLVEDLQQKNASLKKSKRKYKKAKPVLNCKIVGKAKGKWSIEMLREINGAHGVEARLNDEELASSVMGSTSTMSCEF